MSLKLGDIVILNEYVKTDLPYRVGERGLILREVKSSNYDYRIQFDDGSDTSVRIEELNRLTEEDKVLMSWLFTNNKVAHIPTGEYVNIEKVDYLNKKAEVKFRDNSSMVEEFGNLRESVLDDNTLPVINFDTKETVVINSEQYKKLLQEKYDVYVRKNKDYGNSFEEQYNEYGLLSAIIRLDDKLRRLKQLRENKANVKDESIRDTALDLANYADMLVMVLDKGVK
jgi:hypothetical protein